MKKEEKKGNISINWISTDDGKKIINQAIEEVNKKNQELKGARRIEQDTLKSTVNL